MELRRGNGNQDQFLNTASNNRILYCSIMVIRRRGLIGKERLTAQKRLLHFGISFLGGPQHMIIGIVFHF
jgi:hypothetical protein